jgi:hypothetical protein
MGTKVLFELKEGRAYKKWSDKGNLARSKALKDGYEYRDSSHKDSQSKTEEGERLDSSAIREAGFKEGIKGSVDTRGFSSRPCSTSLSNVLASLKWVDHERRCRRLIRVERLDSIGICWKSPRRGVALHKESKRIEHAMKENLNKTATTAAATMTTTTATTTTNTALMTGREKKVSIESAVVLQMKTCRRQIFSSIGLDHK